MVVCCLYAISKPREASNVDTAADSNVAVKGDASVVAAPAPSGASQLQRTVGHCMSSGVTDSFKHGGSQARGDDAAYPAHEMEKRLSPPRSVHWARARKDLIRMATA
ncbi:hypothetical protein RJ55_02904 [Drechmeria coniospora]|nr:hypothetical protein RJ55_02904 [Drechmeria coniospora]